MRMKYPVFFPTFCALDFVTVRVVFGGGAAAEDIEQAINAALEHALRKPGRA